MSDHPVWQSLRSAPIVSADIVTSEVDIDSSICPVALRLANAEATLWVVVAQPTNALVEALDSESVYLGSDEVIVLVGDAVAKNIGLRIRK